MPRTDAVPANPLLDHYLGWDNRGRGAEEVAGLRRRFAFAVPTPEALEAIRELAPGGVVEIGAGRGYWAGQLEALGVEVRAFDLVPPSTGGSRWFPDEVMFHPVTQADHTVVGQDASRALLMVWPTKGEAWPAECLECFHAAGGSVVVYVGQPPGGATGDPWFHALLGEVPTCVACRYGVPDAPCTCDIVPQWRRRTSLKIPSFEAGPDELRIYDRLDYPDARGTRGPRRWRPMRR